MPAHNTPNLPELTSEERSSVEAALEAMQSLKKTFEFWMTIAQALRALRDKADQIGGRFTFDRLRDREGLGAELLDKTRVSRLLAILARREEVERWRATLASNQRFKLASPESIWQKCPIFHSSKGEDTATAEKKPSQMAQLKDAVANLEDENHRLRKRADQGSLFDLKRDTAEDIAKAIVENLLSDSKAERIARGMLALIKAKKVPAG
jgi:hypothetical protein